MIMIYESKYLHKVMNQIVIKFTVFCVQLSMTYTTPHQCMATSSEKCQGTSLPDIHPTFLISSIYPYLFNTSIVHLCIGTSEKIYIVVSDHK